MAPASRRRVFVAWMADRSPAGRQRHKTAAEAHGPSRCHGEGNQVPELQSGEELMNGLLGNNYRKVAGTEGARYEHSMQRTRVSSGARLLGFVSLAAMLILGNSSAFAQESKPAAQVTKPAAESE